MKISTKGRYGLRAMVDLAMHYNGKQIPIKDISERQNVSESYLEQVFSTLKKSGLVKSVQGAGGGYFLADTPENISVLSILRVLEGDLSIREAVDTEQPSIQHFLDLYLWRKMDDVIENILSSLTLADLIYSYNKEQGQQHMYYI